MKKEADFIKACLPEITGDGDRVYAEVRVLNGFIDIVVQHPSGERTAYEFKTRNAGTCIVQAKDRRQWCDRAVAVVARPKDRSTRYTAEMTARAAGVGLFWVWPEGHIDVVVDPVTRRPCEGNVAAMTDQLIESEQMGQEAGSRSPRSLTEHEQILVEAEALVKEQGPLLPKEIGWQLHRQFGRDSTEIRRIVTRRIKEGKGRSLGLERKGDVDVVVLVD